jgi:hypothetical protein
MNLVLAGPAPLRQGRFDGISDQLTGRTMFFLSSRPYFRKQVGRKEAIACGLGFHIIQDSRPTLTIKRINDFKTVVKGLGRGGPFVEMSWKRQRESGSVKSAGPARRSSDPSRSAKPTPEHDPLSGDRRSCDGRRAHLTVKILRKGDSHLLHDRSGVAQVFLHKVGKAIRHKPVVGMTCNKSYLPSATVVGARYRPSPTPDAIISKE